MSFLPGSSAQPDSVTTWVELIVAPHAGQLRVEPSVTSPHHGQVDCVICSNPYGDARTLIESQFSLVQSCERGSCPCRRRNQLSTVVTQYSSLPKNPCRETRLAPP